MPHTVEVWTQTPGGDVGLGVDRVPPTPTVGVCVL